MHDACCQVRQGASPMWVTIPGKKKLHLRRDLYSSPVQNKTMISRWCKDEDIRNGLQCFLVLPIVQNQQRHFVLIGKPHRHNAIRPIRLLTARCRHPELWTFSPCPDEKAQLSWCPWSVLYVAGQMHLWLYSPKNLSFTPLDNWRLSNEFQDSYIIRHENQMKMRLLHICCQLWLYQHSSSPLVTSIHHWLQEFGHPPQWLWTGCWHSKRLPTLRPAP